MILQEFDPVSAELIDVRKHHPPMEEMPKVMVSCFASVTFERMLQGLNAVPIAQSKSANMVYPIYRAEVDGLPLAFQMAAVGAPCCVASLDECFARGVETVVLFGNCGVLDRNIADCSIIIPTSAMRDEGTSFHYAPPSDEIAVNPRYTQLFEQLLRERGISFTSGKCWTTDAFYRENYDRMRRRKAAGCVCVDMECSAVAAMAQFRQKEVFQFFYAADNLDAEKWDERSLSQHSLVEEKDRVAQLALDMALRVAKRKPLQSLHTENKGGNQHGA